MTDSDAQLPTDLEAAIAHLQASPVILAETMGRLNYESVSARVCDLMNFRPEAVHPWDSLTLEHRQAWIDSALLVLKAGQ